MSEARNASISLKSYLQDVDAAVKALPSEWVRCELHTLKAGDKFTKMEFIELDGQGKQVAKANGGCFPSTWKRIDDAFRAAGLRLEEGSQVLVRMQAAINPAYGFNVGVLDIDVTFALGDLNARIQAIRKQLQDAGHWDRNRRLERPVDYLRVAVISPSGAAGLGDFRSTADRLTVLGLVQFDYYEAPFQTRDAPARIVEILRGIYREAGSYCAVAIIRGGGASADLAWLIDQKLTEAVCRMNVPVITGIGHERDRNLLDEVSCIACDTPSKVAELISRTVTQAALAGSGAYDAIVSHVSQELDRAMTGATRIAHVLERDAREAMRVAEGVIDVAVAGLEPDARSLLDWVQSDVAACLEDVRHGARRTREDASDDVSSMRRQMENVVQDALRSVENGASRASSEIMARVEGVPRSTMDDMTRIVEEIRRSAVQNLNDASASASVLSRQAIDLSVRTVDDMEGSLALIMERARALDPRTVLAAGYAILRDANGKPLVGAEPVASCEIVRAEMRDGTVDLMPASPTPKPRKSNARKGKATSNDDEHQGTGRAATRTIRGRVQGTGGDRGADEAGAGADS